MSFCIFSRTCINTEMPTRRANGVARKSGSALVPSRQWQLSQTPVPAAKKVCRRKISLVPPSRDRNTNNLIINDTDSLDLTPAVFNRLADPVIGVIPIKWCVIGTPGCNYKGGECD